MPDTPTAVLPPAAKLDETALRRLHELDPDGSNCIVARVLEAYDSSLQRLLPQGQSAVEEHDREALRHVVHTLKSSSASVGALALSRQCSMIENRLRDGDDDGLDGLWHALQHEGQRVQLAVQAMLAG